MEVLCLSHPRPRLLACQNRRVPRPSRIDRTNLTSAALKNPANNISTSTASPPHSRNQRLAQTIPTSWQKVIGYTSSTLKSHIHGGSLEMQFGIGSHLAMELYEGRMANSNFATGASTSPTNAVRSNNPPRTVKMSCTDGSLM